MLKRNNSLEERKRRDRAHTWLIIGIFAVALIIRLLGANQFLESDEIHWGLAAKQGKFMEARFVNSPLSLWMVTPFVSLFGAESWTVRLPFILIGMLTIYFVYLCAEMVAGKDAAAWAAMLMAISPWHVLASLQIAYEGSFLTLFFLVGVYYYLRYEREGKKQWFILTGIGFGLMLLSKLSAALFIPFIGLYCLIRNRGLWRTCKETALISLIGICLYMIFPIISIITGSPAFIASFVHLSKIQTVANSAVSNYGLLAIQFLYAILWTGPLLLGLFVLSSVRFGKKWPIFVLWIGFMALFYSVVVQDNFRPMERYMMIVIPPLAILGGIWLSRLKLGERWKLAATSGIGSLMVFMLIGLQKFRLIPFYNKLDFIAEILKIQFDFYVPFTGSSGPLGFYVPLYAILLGFFACGMLMLSGIITKRINRELSHSFFACFVGVGFGFSLFFCLAFVTAISGPNIPNVYKDALSYVNENQLETPLYVFRNPSVIFHLDERYLNHSGYSLSFDYTNPKSYDMAVFGKNLSKYMDDWYAYNDIVFLNEKSQADSIDDGTVLMIDFPYFGGELPIWQRLRGCEEVKRFSSKGYDVGYVFKCRSV